ncbi:MAG TPA: hypothetical protein VHY84_27560 [Bryobacteraceae bacterium]|jgi:hypothetical protein|nr:hypothetical protein [Bryobacteraceae bacterium]
MQSPSVFNNLFCNLTLAILAGVGLGVWSADGQTDIPPQVRSLPIWPGAGAAIRQFPDNFVFRETTGQIVLLYPDPSDPAHRIESRFWLENRVDPHIRASITRTAEGTYLYRYTVENGRDAKTAIWKWSVVGPPSKDTSVSHSIWQGVNAYQSNSAPQALLSSAGPGSYLGWMDSLAKAPIEPGHTQAGFEITSQLRPGITTAYVSGREDPIRVSEDVPESLERQITELQRPEILNKLSVTIGPRFDASMNRADIVQAFENDIRDLEQRGILARDSGFLTQFVRVLEKARASEENSVVTIEAAATTELEEEIRVAAQLALTVRQ